MGKTDKYGDLRRRLVFLLLALVVYRLGAHIPVPGIDRVLPLIDLREQVITFAPQPVITEDNLVVNIDTVLYFTVTDPRAATYEIRDYIFAAEQLTVTTLRRPGVGL